MGKNMGILLLSITVISSAATFLTTQYLVESSSTNDAAFLMGHMTLKVIDENGYVRDYRQTDNVIVLAGWNATVLNLFSGDYDIGQFGGLLQNDNPGPFSHIGIGASPSTAINIDTGLGSELSGCPRSPIVIQSGGAVNTGGTSSILVTVFGGFNEPSDVDCQTADISEAGLFNGTSPLGITMLARNTFTTVPQLGASDFLEIEWDFTFNSGT